MGYNAFCGSIIMQAGVPSEEINYNSFYENYTEKTIHKLAKQGKLSSCKKKGLFKS